MRTTLPIIVALALLLASCAPNDSTGPEEPSPKVSGTACTMEYNPVCGENGITYGNPCMATAEGMAHTPGECTPIGMTYKSRDVEQCAVIRYTCADGEVAFSDETGCGCAFENEEMPASEDVCPYVAHWINATTFEQGCFTSCPQDSFGSQLGMVCIRHIDEAEIRTWKHCATNTVCGEQACGFASHTTDGKDIAWSGDEGWRCLPNDYQDSRINYGLSLRDENGQESMVIS